MRDVIITEKIDGTNAQIYIVGPSTDSVSLLDSKTLVIHGVDGLYYAIYAGSRNRYLSISSDNYGFARWVYENSHELIEDLGPGRHYGEWWGSGIQRNYGLDKGEKRFSLFNVIRWNRATHKQFRSNHDWKKPPVCCDVVPVLDTCTFENLNSGNNAMDLLSSLGSVAAPGFMRPEGIVIYHTSSKCSFKRTFENDKGKR